MLQPIKSMALLAGLFSFSTMANTCPNLEGWYECYTKPNKKYEIEIKQFREDGHDRFDIHVVDEVDYEFVADNKARKFPDNKFLRNMWYTAKCDGERLYTWVQGKAYLGGIKVGKAKLTITGTPKEDSAYIHVKGRLGLVRMNEGRTCKRLFK